MDDFEPIFFAVAELMATVRWTRPGEVVPDSHRFVYVSREVKLWKDLDKSKWPSCMQAEHAEDTDQKTGLPYKTVLGVNWIIYQNENQKKKVLGTVENNCILTGVRRALAPKPQDPGFWDERNTLNGMVHHLYISGRVYKNPGDIDDEGMMVVPIKILVP